MSSEEEAKKAIDALNGSTLGDRSITVNVARPKEERTGGGGGFRGGRSDRAPRESYSKRY
jgi:RNA recognition motif-containing protein